jgi:hypothetical protein
MNPNVSKNTEKLPTDKTAIEDPQDLFFNWGMSEASTIECQDYNGMDKDMEMDLEEVSSTANGGSS